MDLRTTAVFIGTILLRHCSAWLYHLCKAETMQSHWGKELLFLSNAELSNKTPIPKGERKYEAVCLRFRGVTPWKMTGLTDSTLMLPGVPVGASKGPLGKSAGTCGDGWFWTMEGLSWSNLAFMLLTLNYLFGGHLRCPQFSCSLQGLSWMRSGGTVNSSGLETGRLISSFLKAPADLSFFSPGLRCVCWGR